MTKLTKGRQKDVDVPENGEARIRAATLVLCASELVACINAKGAPTTVDGMRRLVARLARGWKNEARAARKGTG